jgi:4-hydroxy-3-polyprenylbenzoate decarboxylase
VENLTGREVALLVSGGSGMTLAVRFAVLALQSRAIQALHVVVTGPGGKVLAHELGTEWTSARGFRDQLPVETELRNRIQPWSDADLMSTIASGSHPLAGVVVLPCSAGMVGSLAHGTSRGLAQRVADVALKQRWPLVVGIRETPMSPILLENLLILARAGAHIVPPLPAYYLKPDEGAALTTFVDHFCLRVLDLLGIPIDREDLRWQG